jgi:hypothetical protein
MDQDKMEQKLEQFNNCELRSLILAVLEVNDGYELTKDFDWMMAHDNLHEELRVAIANSK